MGISALRLRPGFTLRHQRFFRLRQGLRASSQIRSWPGNRGGVNANEVLRIGIPQIVSHTRTPIATLRAETRVAEPVHEFDPHIGRLQHMHAALRGVIRKPVARHRGYHHIKGISRIAAVTAGVGEERSDLVHLEKCARPAVGDHEGHGLGTFTFFMDEVDAHPSHGRPVVTHCVDQPLLGAPVKTGAPVRRQFLDIVKVAAVIPARARYFARPTSVGQATLYVFQNGIGHFDFKRLHIHVTLLICFRAIVLLTNA